MAFNVVTSMFVVSTVVALAVVNVAVFGEVPPITGGAERSSAPPSVRFPDDVTVPLRLMPLTVPVPPTEVTVPAPAVSQANADPVHFKNVAETVGASMKALVFDAVL